MVWACVSPTLLQTPDPILRRVLAEAPTLYRLKANKYAHCYGAPSRAQVGIDPGKKWIWSFVFRLQGSGLRGLGIQSC